MMARHTDWLPRQPNYWFLGLLILCATFTLTNAFLFGPKKGTLVATSSKVCFTQNATFTCTITDPPTDPSLHIQFERNDDSINETDLVRYNDTVVDYTLYDFGAEDENVNIVCCTGPCGSKDAIVATKIMRIYSMPEPVKDIHCEVYNYMGNMTCTWNFGMAYHKNKYPAVTCQFRIPALSASWTTCDAIIDKETGVITSVWSEQTHGTWDMRNLDFNITLTSPCGVTKSAIFLQNTRELVRPAAVIEMASRVVNSTCVHLGWKTEHSAHNKTHRVLANSKWGDLKTVVFDAEEEEHAEVTTTICELHAHTGYTFDIQVIPVAGGYWSEARTLVDTTLESVPGSSPELVAGGYKWDPQDCLQAQPYRDICVYWKGIPEIEQNGVLLGYNIQFLPQTDNGQAITKHSPADYRYSCVRHLDCDVTYNVTITGRTKIGNSPPAPAIHVIPAHTESKPLQPSFIVEITNSSDVNTSTYLVDVGWPEMSQTKRDYLQIQSYTTCWCRRDQGDCKLTQEFQCWSVGGDARMASVNVSNPEDYLYGVSMHTKYGNTGFQWQSCIYMKNAEPKKRPEKVTAVTGVDSYTILVTWDKVSCVSGEPYIAQYTVQYCPVQDCTGKIRELNVTSSIAQVELTDLSKDQMYSVRVRGVTRDGKTSPLSDPATATAKRNGLDDGEIVGVAIGSLFMLVFATAGCIFCIRRNIVRIKKFNKEATNIKMFGPMSEEGNDGYENSIGEDSSGIEQDQEQDTGQTCIDPEKQEEILANGKKIMERQTSKDSGVEDLKSPSTPPAGYVLATTIHEHEPLPNVATLPNGGLNVATLPNGGLNVATLPNGDPNVATLPNGGPNVATVGLVLTSSPPSRKTRGVFQGPLQREKEAQKTALYDNNDLRDATEMKTFVTSAETKSGIPDGYSREDIADVVSVHRQDSVNPAGSGRSYRQDGRDQGNIGRGNDGDRDNTSVKRPNDEGEEDIILDSGYPDSTSPAETHLKRVADFDSVNDYVTHTQDGASVQYQCKDNDDRALSSDNLDDYTQACNVSNNSGQVGTPRNISASLTHIPVPHHTTSADETSPSLMTKSTAPESAQARTSSALCHTQSPAPSNYIQSVAVTGLPAEPSPCEHSTLPISSSDVQLASNPTPSQSVYKQATIPPFNTSITASNHSPPLRAQSAASPTPVHEPAQHSISPAHEASNPQATSQTNSLHTASIHTPNLEASNQIMRSRPLACDTHNPEEQVLARGHQFNLSSCLNSIPVPVGDDSDSGSDVPPVEQSMAPAVVSQTLANKGYVQTPVLANQTGYVTQTHETNQAGYVTQTHEPKPTVLLSQNPDGYVSHPPVSSETGCVGTVPVLNKKGDANQTPVPNQTGYVSHHISNQKDSVNHSRPVPNESGYVTEIPNPHSQPVQGQYNVGQGSRSNEVKAPVVGKINSGYLSDTNIKMPATTVPTFNTNSNSPAPSFNGMPTAANMAYVSEDQMNSLSRLSNQGSDNGEDAAGRSRQSSGADSGLGSLESDTTVAAATGISMPAPNTGYITVNDIMTQGNSCRM